MCAKLPSIVVCNWLSSSGNEDSICDVNPRSLLVPDFGIVDQILSQNFQLRHAENFTKDSMRGRLEALVKAINDDDLHNAILQGMANEIEDNNGLEAALGELLPFLSDGDRNIRIQAMGVLAKYNMEFKAPVIRKSIAEMAGIKLADSACLASACDILDTNLKILEKEAITKLFNMLLAADLRTCVVSVRVKAYRLMGSMVARGAELDADRSKAIGQVKSFCGYEQDPRGLAVVFDVVPKLMRQIVGDLESADKREMFDILGAFYPIISDDDLNRQNVEAMAAVPEFADELAMLVASKLKSSLADTRPVIYRELDSALVHKTAKEHVVDVITAFMQSLKSHFEGGSTSADDETVENAMSAVNHFVEINEDAWKWINAVAVSEWIPELLHSSDNFLIRAYSIVIWNIDKYLHFATQVMAPLTATAEEAVKAKDEARIQSVLASVVEYLKLQEIGFDAEHPELEPFLPIAMAALQFDNANLQITGLVTIRELATRSRLSVNDGLLPAILSQVKAHASYVSQCLLAVSLQASYADIVNKEFTVPFCKVLSEKSDSELFGTQTEAVRFAAEVSKSPIFAGPIAVCFANAKSYSALLTTLCNLESLQGETGVQLLTFLGSGDPDIPPKVVLAIGLRTPDSVMVQLLTAKSPFRHLLLAAAVPSAVPQSIFDLEPSEQETILLTAKFDKYPTGFTPHPIGLAVRGTFVASFEPSMIPRLLDFENMFDGALGAFDKAAVLTTRFIYTDYKPALWEGWYSKLDSQPEYLLQLCLLCPPAFYEHEMLKIIHHFPAFMKCNIKGGLDLLIFSLLNMDNRKILEFFKVLKDVIQALLDALRSDNARIRLDACRVLHILASHIPGSALSSFKPTVVREFRPLLDDPKREVRMEAGESRCAWMHIDEQATFE